MIIINVNYIFILKWSFGKNFSFNSQSARRTSLNGEKWWMRIIYFVAKYK